MGNSAGIILPKPVLTELGVEVGDDLSLTLGKAGSCSCLPRRILAPAGRKLPDGSQPQAMTD
jgi:antitoxin component of MazEF toxin-antitoxin module